MKYQFDTLDRLNQLTYPVRYGQGETVGKLETMLFDEASRVKELTYDSISRASAITYNAASQTTALNIGSNGSSQLSESYTYEPATGLLSNQKVQRQGAASPLLDLSYEYTKYGTSVGRTGQLTKLINNKDTTKSKYYEYDTLGRLKTLYSFTNGNNPMTTNQWTQAYTYDRFGNRTGVTKAGTIGVTDGIAALSFTPATNRILTAGYEYDEAGNLTRGQTEDTAPGTLIWRRYQYDAAGRLACTKADDNTTVLATYSYGASNHRLKQVEAGTTCYYAWDGNSILAEYTEPVGQTQLNWAKSYVYLGARLLATQTPSATNYHHPDRLGTRLVTSAATAVEQTEQTTLPYGTALDAESWGTATNRRFTSYDRSQATKLDYAVNRFYSACQGRFTQVDPIGMQAASLTDPQSLNLYAYVGGDPINRIDPDGLFWGAIGRFFKKLAIAILVALGVMAAGQMAPINFRTPGFNGNAGLPSLSGGGASRPNIFRTPGINGNAVGGVGRFVNGFQGSQGSGGGGIGTVYDIGFVLRIETWESELGWGRILEIDPKWRCRARGECDGNGNPIEIMESGVPSPSYLLARALTNAGVKRLLGQAAHHMVAAGDARATISRAILQRHNIDINSAYNGVYLAGSRLKAALFNLRGIPHSILHTRVYYDEINRIISAADIAGGRQAVVSALGQIRQALLNGTFKF